MNKAFRHTLFLTLAVFLIALPFTLRAQQPVAPPQAPTPQQPEDKTTQAQREFQQEEQQRMAGIVPAFRVVLSGTAAPIKPSQKFELFVKDAFDPFSFAVAVADSAWQQYRDDYPTWGTQADGYGKRFAASFGDELDGNLWGRAILPSVLHQDPRYFRLGHGGFAKRFGYSLASIARTKGDNGKWQPNYSLVGGDLIAGGVSNVYYPASTRGVGQTFQRSFTVVGIGALSSFADEFYPDVVAAWNRTFKRKPKPYDPYKY